METETVEFNNWLKKNSNRFRSCEYGTDQVAMLAILCGFPRTIVFSGINDELTRVKRLVDFWGSPFLDKWIRLASYERGTE